MEAFLRPGTDPRNWHERAIEVGSGLVPTGAGEMSLYTVQNYRTDQVHIRRAVLREDGFISVHANYAGGELITRPFTFSGSKLALNYSTSAAGSLRVELQDIQGHPLPGRSLDHSVEMFGDEIGAEVIWDEGPGVGPWAGQPVRLRFVLRDADLFSFQFHE